MSSTRCCTGTGLKKWRPSTCSGRSVAIASFMIGIDDVFDARIASSSSTILSRFVNTSSFSSLRLDDGFDHELTVAEVADVGGERDAREHRVAARRRRACSRAPRGRATYSMLLAACVERSSGSMSHTITWDPERAQTSAIPEPMSPAPTTPTRSMPTCSPLADAVAQSIRREHPWPQCTDRALRRRLGRATLSKRGPLQMASACFASHSRTIARNSSRTRSSRRCRELAGRLEMRAGARRWRRASSSSPRPRWRPSSSDRRRTSSRCSAELEHAARGRGPSPSTPPRSALLTTNTSPISSRPALLAWTASPHPGLTTTIVVSAAPAISTST